MAERGFKRKLTAILSADVEGYSRLMGEDEEATVQTLTAYREVLSTITQQHNGKVVDSPGDNLLAEFASVIDSVQCAVAVQKEIKARNNELPGCRRMHFRIGINLGDVIQDGIRIYGDGVNIAARLEQLAETDGICISGSVYDQVKNKLPLHFNYIGDRSVKNISDPVSAYRVIWQEEASSPRTGKQRRVAGLQFINATERPLLANIVITCLVMVVIMPLINLANINLLTKIWQCRNVLLPNCQKVTVVTIEPDEHKKMNIKNGKEQPGPYQSNPKMWRQYHPKVIKILRELGTEVVGFDFWYSPAYDGPTKLATKKFIEGLNWSRKNSFPVVLGQAENLQDPVIYKVADWGSTALQIDLTWTNKLLYLKAWDIVKNPEIAIARPSLFVQVLARKLRLIPKIDRKGVHLIGKHIPRRLWLAFSQTPIKKVAYHEVYNGWADKASFSGRIVLIGLSSPSTDYFQTRFSPRDFTPDDKDDSYGMPGVFLQAHAINQIINGYYHLEIDDEWYGFFGETGFSIIELKGLIVLLLEIVIICLVLYGAKFLFRRKARVKLNFFVMSIAAAVLTIVLALTPVLFGLTNFVIASLIFIPLAAKQTHVGRL